MRIAMLVHNSVMSDARVQKEARSLRACGHTVEIHGIASGPVSEEYTLSGTDVRVFLAGGSGIGRVNLEPSPSRIRQVLSGGAVVLGYPLVVLGTVGIKSVRRGVIAARGSGGRIAGGIARTIGHLRVRLFSGAASAAEQKGANHWVLRILAACWGGARMYVANVHSSTRYIYRKSCRLVGGLCRRTKRVVVRVGRRVRRWLVGRVLRSNSLWASRMLSARYRTLGARVLESLLERPRPDVVHIHDHIALTGARWLKENMRCPLVWDAHEIYEALGGDDKARLRANRAVIQEMQVYVDHFVTISRSIADFYQRNYPDLGEATVVMNAKPRGSTAHYDGRLHEAAGIPRDRKILLYQGGFATGRGLHHLVRSAAHISPDWSVVLMGWGALEQELLALADREVRDSKRLVFLPGVAQDELEIWTRGATLGAIPYEDTGLNHRYCTPNKLWEYPEAGIPILCTDLEELGKIVRCNGIGFVLPRQFDGSTIARVVSGIDDTTLARSQTACASFIESNHWGIYGERLCDLYSRIAGQQSSIMTGMEHMGVGGGHER